MRSRRVSRRELKAEVAALKDALGAVSEVSGQPAEPQEVQPQVEAPKIASCGYPLRSKPQSPKSLKEAKEILMNMREW